MRGFLYYSGLACAYGQLLLTIVLFAGPVEYSNLIVMNVVSAMIFGAFAKLIFEVIPKRSKKADGQ
jgi:ABC-type uncharacterized transport system permease subunit